MNQLVIGSNPISETNQNKSPKGQEKAPRCKVAIACSVKQTTLLKQGRVSLPTSESYQPINTDAAFRLGLAIAQTASEGLPVSHKV